MRAGGDFWGEENILYSGFACAGISAFFFVVSIRRVFMSRFIVGLSALSGSVTQWNARHCQTSLRFLAAYGR